jgi:cell division protein FtsN
LLGVAVGLVLFFGLGFLVGIWYQANENIRPNDHAIALAEEQLQREQAPKAAAQEMTFYSTLTTREGDPVASTAAAQPPAAPVPPAPASVPQVPDGATGPIQAGEGQAALPERPVPKAEPQGQASAQAEPEPPKSAAPPVASTSQVQTAALAASPPPPGTSFYTVQVGSFRRDTDAQRLLQQLAQKGYAARLLSITLPGKGLWHRVRIGTFAERAEANEMAQRLRRQENLTVLVTSE